MIFRDLRRTYGRNLVRAAVPERVAMAIGSHKARAVFDRYNIISERDLTGAARTLHTYLTQKNANSTSRASAGLSVQGSWLTH